MPIDARCPFCNKAYRLKDELSGKNVTCANGACRKIFQVVALDADTIAAAALSDEIPAQKPAEQRTVGMSCVICEHKWTLPEEMQGKNVLCPECKHRQKVPEQKSGQPADWRTGGGGPSLAKRETLEDVISARDTAMVSGETLRATGIIDDGVEPLPLKVKLQRIGLGVALLAAIAFGIVYWIGGKRQRVSEQFVEDLVQLADGDEFKTLPHHRALLKFSLAEYAARQNDEKQLQKAVEWFGAAQNSLAAMPRGADRDCISAEMVLALLNLGGSSLQVAEKQRLPWTPQVGRAARAAARTNRAEEEGVLGPLRRGFEGMQANFADFDLRAWTARRLIRQIIARQIPAEDAGDLMLAVLSGFSPAEMPEVQAQIGLELYRAGRKDEAKERAEMIASQMSANPQSASLAAPVLLKLCGVQSPAVPADFPAGEEGRWARTAFALVSGDAAKALEEAKQAGPDDARVRALSYAAEWSDQPQPFVEAAAAIVSDFLARGTPDQSLSAYPLLRLARTAAAADPVTARGFLKAIIDTPLRTFGEAEVLRRSLAASKTVAADDQAPLPGDPANPKEFLLGHAWGRLQLARHNGGVEAGLPKKYLTTWPKPLVAPFGAVGALLGEQDRTVQP